MSDKGPVLPWGTQRPESLDPDVVLQGSDELAVRCTKPDCEERRLHYHKGTWSPSAVSLTEERERYGSAP